MKRRRRLFALLLALLMTVSLSGCGMFETKLARAIQKMSNLDDLHFRVSAELTLELRVAGQEAADADGEEPPAEPDFRSLPVQGSYTAEGNLYTDPLRISMQTLLRYPGTETAQECYVEKEDQAYYLYSRSTDGTLWQKQGMAEQEQTRVKGLRYIVESVSTFEQTAEEALDGKPALRYDGVLSGENIEMLLKLYRVESFLTEGMGLSLTEGLLEELDDVPASLWIDEDSGMLVRGEADLTSLAETIAARQLAANREALDLESIGLELALTGLQLRVELSAFNEAESFAIPDEAKAAWGDDIMPWEK